ncbi:MAG: sigma factor-like helix-turn-helix DNA-binding protein, partial [bacterium]
KRMTNDANDDFSADPIDNIVDKSADIFRQVFPEMKPSKKLIQKLQVYMGKLTNQQRDFIYDFFGLQMTVEDIARRDGVSHQAVTNRKNKILKRLKAMFKADGLL